MGPTIDDKMVKILTNSSNVYINFNKYKHSNIYHGFENTLAQVYKVELGRADIAAIQQLYGPKTSKTLTTRFAWPIFKLLNAPSSSSSFPVHGNFKSTF